MIIDRATFNEQYGDFDREIMLDILDTFLNDCPMRMKEIEKSIQEKDFKSVEFNAHKLKGAISVFTITAPFELAQDIVDKARENDNNGIEDIYKKLEVNIVYNLFFSFID